MEGDVTREFDWVFNGTTDGWVPQQATLDPSLSGMVMVNTGTASRAIITDISIDGATNQLVVIEFTRVTSTAGTWFGRLSWRTAGHESDVNLYHKLFDDVPVGVRTRVVLDMSTPEAGGTDWITSTITGLRIGFETGGTSEFVIHNVRVGHPASASEATGSDRCFNTRATCQDLDHFDANPDGLGGLVEKIESYKASPASATLDLAGRPLGAISEPGDGRRYLATLSYYRAAGDTSLAAATVAGRRANIRGQASMGGAGTALIDCEWLTDETSGTIHLEFADAIDHFGLVSYDTRSLVYDSIDTDNSGSPSDTLVLPIEKGDRLFGHNTSWLMGSTSWTRVTENTDDFQVSMGLSAASVDVLESLPDPAGQVVVTRDWASTAAPTIVSHTQIAASGNFWVSAAITGLQAGDLAIAYFEARWDDAPRIVAPAGWNVMPGSPLRPGGANTTSLHVMWTRSTGSSIASATFNNNLVDHIGGTVTVFRGVKTNGDPWNQMVTGQNITVASMVMDGLTTTFQNSLVIDIVSHSVDSAPADYINSFANPDLTGYAKVNERNVSTGDGGGVAMAAGVKTTAGVVGQSTATGSGTYNSSYVKMALAASDMTLERMSSLVARYTRLGSPEGTKSEIMFAVPASYRPQDPDVIPNIDRITHTSARINPGEDLGSRARLEVAFVDMPHSDTGEGFDPYVDLRDYNPYEQGSFWPKFRARQPFLRGAPMVWYMGEEGQTIDEMEARHFLVENFTGPTEAGEFRIVGLDPLKMLDGDRAQCPVLSEGRLQADITDSQTSLQLTPTGIGETYPTSGLAHIGGDEIVSYTRVGDVMTIVRAQMTTEANEHVAGDRVQVIEVFDSMDVADIIYRLVTEFAYFPPEWIPLLEWQAETEAYLNRVFTAYIAEPTSVNKLVAELMQQAGLSIWWDALGQLLRLRVLRQISTQSEFFDEALYDRGSFRITEQQDKRISQVWTFFGQKNPLLNVDDKYNYRSSVLSVDLEAERSYQSSQVEKIYSRWIAQGGRSAAERVNSLILSRYRIPPRLFSFELVRGAQGNPELGAGYTIGHRVLQDATGALQTVPSQAVSVTVRPGRFRMEVEEFNYKTQSEEDLLNRNITIDASTYDVNCRSLHDDLYGALRTGDNVRILIEPFVVVGSTSYLTPALDVGTWPTLVRSGTKASTGNGVITGLSDTADLAVGLRVMGTGIAAGARIASIDSPTQITLDANSLSTGSTPLTFALVNVTLENRGLIQGAGGPGGTGRSADGGDPSGSQRNGKPGGTGIKVAYPITFIDENGDGSNGGGGGGAGGSCADLGGHRGGGGGGGAGAIEGAAGVGPGNGEDGKNGTLTAGGAYGRSYTSSTFWSSPSLKDAIHGGRGGDPGQAGQNDAGNYDLSGGSPGAAGKWVEGIAFINTQGAVGTRLGPST